MFQILEKQNVQLNFLLPMVKLNITVGIDSGLLLAQIVSVMK